MRKVIVTVAVLQFILSAVVFVPAALIGAQAELIGLVVPRAIAVLALLLLVLVAFDRRPPAASRSSASPESAPELPAIKPPAPVVPEVKSAAVPPIDANQADAEVVAFLSLMQDKGRLVDFLMDDVAGFEDAQVGAAARVVHQGCKAVLAEHFGIRRLVAGAEGMTVAVPAGYAADEYRLVGRISGTAPFTGTLVHAGWAVDWVRLPRLVRRDADDRLPTLAPAEVELG